MPKYWIKFHLNYTNYLGVNFLAVAETIVGLLLCYGVMIVQCLFNLLYYVIWCGSHLPQHYETINFFLSSNEKSPV